MSLYAMKLWKIEEVGEHSVILSSIMISPPTKGRKFLPNPNDEFREKYGRLDYGEFEEKFLAIPKDILHSPETLVLYFDEEVPSWAKEGMEVLY